MYSYHCCHSERTWVYLTSNAGLGGGMGQGTQLAGSASNFGVASVTGACSVTVAIFSFQCSLNAKNVLG